MNNTIDFNTLPDAVSELLTLTREMKRILMLDHTTKEDQRKYLNAVAAQELISEYGISISISRIYKLTASKQIPFLKVGNRLVFNTSELRLWCENQIIDPRTNQDSSIISIVKSAHRQIK